ncbi:hypothetical protein SHIRM173S_07198 [Streptomyces hirsutus]
MPSGRETPSAFSPIGVTLQCRTGGLGKPPVCRGPRSSIRSRSWTALMSSQLRDGLISRSGSIGSSSSAKPAKLPQRVPMPSIPLGPA